MIISNSLCYVKHTIMYEDVQKSVSVADPDPYKVPLNKLINLLSFELI